MCSHSRSMSRGRCGCEAVEASHPSQHVEHHHYPGPGFPGGLGVRRPLRFLGWKLSLSESQVTEFATVLNALKTERAQAEVDDRRALALLADAADSDPYDSGKADEAVRLRVRSTEQVQQKVGESLARMHALLEPEQRSRLAYLLRTGTLVM